MFGSLGFPEIAFILILALLLFGPRRLPEIGRTVGKSLAEFRKASNDLRRTLENEVALDEPKKPTTPATRPGSAPPVPRGAAELAAPKEAAAADGADAAPAGEPVAKPEPAAAETPPTGDASDPGPGQDLSEPTRTD